MYNETELFKTLEELHGDILYKNAEIYASSDWRKFRDLDKYPVQRQLGELECVFDLDNVSEYHMIMIPQWLNDGGFKFNAWKSSETGMHIHFMTQIRGKENKKALVKLLAKKLEDKFGVKNDLGPMGHNVIRMEYGVHPTKKTQKTLLFNNCGTLFPINEIDDAVLAQIEMDRPAVQANSGERGGKIPSCIKYILSHKFADGRERLTFTLISWFKGSGRTDTETHALVFDWCKKQNYNINSRLLWSKVKSCTPRVGCRYRHDLLQELGVDMEHCKWE